MVLVLVGWQIIPVVGPDGFLAVHERVSNGSTLEIGTGVVIFGLCRLDRGGHNHQECQQK